MTERRVASIEDTGTPGAVMPTVVLAVLGLDGVLSAVAGALFLPSYVGRFPFPVSALVSGLVNAALVWAAMHWTASLRLAALPLWTWLVTVAVLSFGGPGDDFIFAGRGLMSYAVLVMIVAGSAPPAWLLWRRRRRGGPAVSVSD